MIRLTRLNDRGGTSGGAAVLDYLKSTAYYLKNGQPHSASEWWGAGAAALGLGKETPVEIQTMDRLAQGYHPGSGEALCQNAGEKSRQVQREDADGNLLFDAEGKPRMKWQGGHRVGLDITFSQEKSVSILFADSDEAGKQSILDAHNRAVDATLAFLEQRMETRRGKGGIDVIGAHAMVVSKHLHFDARDGGKGPDPALHTHALCYGIAQGEDGKWGTFDQKPLADAVKAAGALFRAQMAREMQQLGYGIRKHEERTLDGDKNGEVFYRIAGTTEQAREEFSQRHTQIKEYQDEHGVSDQAAWSATRKAKKEQTYSELVHGWTGRIAGVREQHPDWMPSPGQLIGRPDELGLAVSDEEVLQKLHEHKAIFTRTDLLERLALENVGRLDLKGIEKEADSFVRRNKLERIQAIALHSDDRGDRLAARHTEVRYAAPWMLAVEQEIIDRAAARVDEHAVKIAAPRVSELVDAYEKKQGKTLSDEQRQVVSFVCAETGGVAMVEGRAGTGKTFTAGAWQSVFKEEGCRIVNCATGWKAAKNLEQETGEEAYSIASMLARLERGSLRLDSKTVVVVDEAAMVGHQHLLQVQRWADGAGSKLVLQGDHLQLQSVSAGSPWMLARGEVGTRSLTEIRRQAGQQDRDTANLFYTHDEQLRSRAENVHFGRALMDKLDQGGQVHRFADTPQALQGLMDDYFSCALPASEKLVIAGRNSDVERLNLAIRNGMQARGMLATDEVSVDTIRNGRYATRLPLAEGEQIVFGKRAKLQIESCQDELEVINGMRGVVEKIQQSQRKIGSATLRIRVESTDKKLNDVRIELDTADYPHLNHAYAGTVHKAQGQGAPAVFHLADAGTMDRSHALVAFTRTKISYGLYGADEDLDPERIEERMGTDRLQENAISARLGAADAQTMAASKSALLEIGAKNKTKKIEILIEAQWLPHERTDAEREADRQAAMATWHEPEEAEAVERFLREREAARREDTLSSHQSKDDDDLSRAAARDEARQAALEAEWEALFEAIRPQMHERQKRSKEHERAVEL